MQRFSHVDPGRRPRASNKMVVASPALEHAEYIPRQHAVTLTAADRAHATSPMAVGKAIEEQLRTPPHQLRVTAHHPEAFLVHFDMPAHRDNTVHRGVIKVDASKYYVRAWHPDDHAAILKLTLHVRIVVENLPMQFWSLEGADEAFGDFSRIDRLDSRTFERGHTKTFACWLWCWDVTHIPTKRALWVLKRGAGRVDEILGFSPPDRNVPPLRASTATTCSSMWIASRTGPRSRRDPRTPARAGSPPPMTSTTGHSRARRRATGREALRMGRRDQGAAFFRWQHQDAAVVAAPGKKLSWGVAVSPGARRPSQTHQGTGAGPRRRASTVREAGGAPWSALLPRLPQPQHCAPPRRFLWRQGLLLSKTRSRPSSPTPEGPSHRHRALTSCN